MCRNMRSSHVLLCVEIQGLLMFLSKLAVNYISYQLEQTKPKRIQTCSCPLMGTGKGAGALLPAVISVSAPCPLGKKQRGVTSSLWLVFSPR